MAMCESWVNATTPEFLTSANIDSKKNVSFECSEIVGVCQRKAYNEVIWLTKRF